MKILALDQGEHLGGAERFFSDILARLSSSDEVHLLCSDNPKYKQLYQGSQVHLHKAELPKLKTISISTFKKLRRSQKGLQELIDELKPDLIISNTVRTHLISSSVAAQNSIPLIWMGHDMTFPKFLLKRFTKYPEKIICCSQFVADYFNSSKTTVLYPFGIDQEKLDHLKSVTKKPIIGMVGKFIPWKGQFEFLKAAQQLHEQFPEYQFVLIADEYQGVKESHEYAKKCRDFIIHKQLEGVITIKSGIPDLLEELASWQALVHCSQKPEPLGRVIIEGMAAGCCVIAANSGGPREIISNGETGVLSSPDAENINNQLFALLSDHKKLRQLQNDAQQEVQKYNWDQQIEIYRELLLIKKKA